MFCVTAKVITLIVLRITLVNLGLWRYCYDDQLYDLIEIVNPQFSNLGIFLLQLARTLTIFTKFA